MENEYRVIEIHTSEEERHGGMPLSRAVLERVRDLRLPARCIVTKGVAGLYEDGGIATHGIEALSFNMPVKIEIVLPAADLDALLPELSAMVTEGILLVGTRRMAVHRAGYRLLPRHLRVRDVMTADPVSVTEGTSAAEATEILLSAPFKGLPVVDGDGRPVGMVTPGDLVGRAGLPMRPDLLRTMDPAQVRAFLAVLPRKTVAGFMSSPAVAVPSGEPLPRAAERMLAANLKRMPVVDADGKLCGMLSRIDLFRAIARDAPARAAVAGPAVEVRGGRLVRDVMRRDMETVPPEAPLEELIRRIGAPGAQRFAVADAEGRLLGLVTDRILLSSIAKQRGGGGNLLTGGFSFAKWFGGCGEAGPKTARDVMCADLVTVREETPVDEAIRIMVERSLKRLPVVDADGRFLGMVGREWLLRAGLEELPPEPAA